MKNILARKALVVILGGCVILAVAILAAGISTLKFKPAGSFGFEQPSPPPQSASSARPLTVEDESLLIPVLLFAAVCLVLFVRLTPQQRKKVLVAFVRLAVFLVVIGVLVNRIRIQRSQVTNDGVIENLQPGGSLPASPGAAPQAFSPPSLPPWMIYLASLTFLLVSGGLIWWGYRLYRRKNTAPPLDELARIARSALNEIQSGVDWEDAVIQCYLRMNAAASIRRSLVRQIAETPTEFVKQLESAGLPGAAVRRLTVLFERVRYGAKKTTQEDKNEAVACLTAILHACGEAL
jgi:hypothetical protein